MAIFSYAYFHVDSNNSHYSSTGTILVQLQIFYTTGQYHLILQRQISCLVFKKVIFLQFAALYKKRSIYLIYVAISCIHVYNNF